MKLTFTGRKKEAGNAFTFTFKPRRKLEFIPGQYMFYTIPVNKPDNRGVTRYFTNSSAPFEREVRITTRISKDSSTFKKNLLKLKPGTRVEASGPDGDFVVDDPKRPLVFIAGGIGITPFRSILVQSHHDGQNLNVQLLYANRDENIVFREELDSLKQKNPNLNIQYFISPTRINNETIHKLLAISHELFFYISGPSPFVRVIRDMIKEKGVPKENIKLDLFPGYS